MMEFTEKFWALAYSEDKRLPRECLRYSIVILSPVNITKKTTNKKVCRGCRGSTFLLHSHRHTFSTDCYMAAEGALYISIAIITKTSAEEAHFSFIDVKCCTPRAAEGALCISIAFEQFSVETAAKEAHYCFMAVKNTNYVNVCRGNALLLHRRKQLSALASQGLPRERFLLHSPWTYWLWNIQRLPWKRVIAS